MNPEPLRSKAERFKLRGDMTVCIAARCDAKDGKSYIVTVSDTKLTTGIYSSDRATLKLRHITTTWKCLISGKFSQHRPLVDRIVDATHTKEGTPSYGDVSKACTDAFIAENKRLAEESILAQYGMTMEDFIQRRVALGDVLYERIWGEIGRIKLGCDLLVCGFDGDGFSHIFIASNPTYDNPSFITDCDYPGFGTIGTGSYLADSSLYGSEQNPASSLLITIYNLAIAKFSAESASDVGEQTYLYVFNETGTKVKMGTVDDLEDVLREQWRSHGKPTIPQDMFASIMEALPEHLRG